MLITNFRKNNHNEQEKINVNIDVKVSILDAFSDGYLKMIVNKIKHETKDIPHVNVKIHIL